MAGNNDQFIEGNLQRRYNIDFDWSLIPNKIQQVSTCIFPFN